MWSPGQAAQENKAIVKMGKGKESYKNNLNIREDRVHSLLSAENLWSRQALEKCWHMEHGDRPWSCSQSVQSQGRYILSCKMPKWTLDLEDVTLICRI